MTAGANRRRPLGAPHVERQLSPVSTGQHWAVRGGRGFQPGRLSCISPEQTRATPLRPRFAAGRRLDVKRSPKSIRPLGAQRPGLRSGGQAVDPRICRRRAAFRETDSAQSAGACRRGHLHLQDGQVRRPGAAVASRAAAGAGPQASGLSMATNSLPSSRVMRFGGEGAGLVGETVRRHEEGLVRRARAAVIPRSSCTGTAADGLVEPAAQDDRAVQRQDRRRPGTERMSIARRRRRAGWFWRPGCPDPIEPAASVSSETLHSGCGR